MIVSLKAIPLQEEPCCPRTIGRQQPSVFVLTIGAPEIVVQTSVVLTALWDNSELAKRSGALESQLFLCKLNVEVETERAFGGPRY